MEFQFASRTQEINSNSFADSMKDREGKSMQPPALQLKSFGGDEDEEDKAVQKKSTESPTTLSSEENVKAKQTFGMDMSDVKIHQNSNQATELGAQAFTQGTDVVFGKGHDKSTPEGKELLGHELAHVAQQKAGQVSPTTSVNNLPVNDDKKLESQADSLGAAFANTSAKKEEE